MAVRWIQELVRSHNGENRVLVLNMREGREVVGVDQLETWLDEPNHLTVSYIDSLMDMVQPDMGSKKRKQVEALVKVAVGLETVNRKDIGGQVFTQEDLVLEEEKVEKQEAMSSWELDTNSHRWQILSLGCLVGQCQDWESLWMSEDTAWEEEQPDREQGPEIRQFEIGTVDWTPKRREQKVPTVNAKNTVPAFYRNEQIRGSPHERKRAKRREQKVPTVNAKNTVPAFYRNEQIRGS